jgi:hypothetical protein
MGWNIVMKNTLLAVGFTLTIGNVAPAFSSNVDSRGVWAASAMAEADYYRSNPCTWWKVDEQAVRKVVAWSGRTLEELRASEEYREQRDAIMGTVKQFGAEMACEAGGANFDAEEHGYGVLRSR